MKPPDPKERGGPREEAARNSIQSRPQDVTKGPRIQAETIAALGSRLPDYLPDSPAGIATRPATAPPQPGKTPLQVALDQPKPWPSSHAEDVARDMARINVEAEAAGENSKGGTQADER